MTRIMLSDLSFENYAPHLAVALTQGGSDRASDAVVALAGMKGIKPTDQDAMARAVNRWLADVGEDARLRNVAAHDEYSRLHHPAVAAFLGGLGVETSALRMLSAVDGGCATAVVDLGDPGDIGTFAQCGMSRMGERDEITVPLGPGIYWSGDALLIFSGTIPETLAHDCVGRAATDLVGHPALEGATITGSGGDVNSFRRFTLEGVEMRPWGKGAQGG